MEKYTWPSVTPVEPAGAALADSAVRNLYAQQNEALGAWLKEQHPGLDVLIAHLGANICALCRGY